MSLSRVQRLAAWATGGCLLLFGWGVVILIDSKRTGRDALEGRVEAFTELSWVTCKEAYWEWDTRGESLYWSPRLYEVYGVPEGYEASYDSWLELVHPADRERADIVCREAAVKGESYVMNYRLRSGRSIKETVIMVGPLMVGSCKIISEAGNPKYEQDSPDM